MIFGRCAFIIIYFALSGIIPSSARATSNVADLASKRERITLGPTTVPQQQLLATVIQLEGESTQPSIKRLSSQLRLEDGLKDGLGQCFARLDGALYQCLPEADRDADAFVKRFSLNKSLNSIEKLNSKINLVAIDDASDSKALENRDLYLALGAMALTFAISLFLIWLLFKQPSPSKSEITDTDLGSRSVKEPSVDDNLVIDTAIAPSTANLESERHTYIQPQNASNLDPVLELIRDLQFETAEADFNHLSSSDAVTRITQRREAIWKLTQTGDCRSIEPLLKIMPYAEESDKNLIIAAVNQIIDRSFKPIGDWLFANLQDVNPEVRLSAIRDLKNLYQFVTPVITKISQMQSDVDYGVRQTAIQTLGQFNANPFPTFSQATQNSDQKTDNLVSGEESEANLHLVAYLLAELDAEK